MRRLGRIFRTVMSFGEDERFLHLVEGIESLISKVLSVLMVLVTIVAVYDLGIFLVQELANEVLSPNSARFSEILFKIFGLFLNVLIALEILENITAYLKKHVIQVELVIVTSLIAVARKIIILDLSKTTGLDVIGLGVAILSLSVSYWVIRRVNSRHPN
ncbi:phosphate-starvation-inducible PsiE family protein [Phormidesmis priestleyi]